MARRGGSEGQRAPRWRRPRSPWGHRVLVAVALGAVVVACGGSTESASAQHGGNGGTGAGGATTDGSAGGGSGGSAGGGAGGSAGGGSTGGAGSGSGGSAGASGGGGSSLGGFGGTATCSAYGLGCATPDWLCQCSGAEYWCRAVVGAPGPEPLASLPAEAPAEGAACAFEGWCWSPPVTGGELCRCQAGAWACAPMPSGTCPQPLEDGAPCDPVGLTCGGGCTECTCVPGPTGGRLHCLALPC